MPSQCLGIAKNRVKDLMERRQQQWSDEFALLLQRNFVVPLWFCHALFHRIVIDWVQLSRCNIQLTVTLWRDRFCVALPLDGQLDAMMCIVIADIWHESWSISFLTDVSSSFANCVCRFFCGQDAQFSERWSSWSTFVNISIRFCYHFQKILSEFSHV